MDLIDEIVSDWKVQRPDIDCSGKALVCSLLRGYSIIIAALEHSLKAAYITPNVFSILVTVRRKGEHAEVTVKTVMQEVLVTSGGMSNMISKLIEAGLITKA